MSILALDPATSTGWAVWSPKKKELDYGVRLFRKKPGDHAGVRFDQYRKFLQETIEFFKPKWIYYEHPLFPGIRTARHNLTVGFGFEAILWMQASLDNIPLFAMHPATLKKWATGDGKATKEMMVWAAQRMTGEKLEVSQDDEADALCLAMFAAQELGEATL